jgi:hypothetical protein
VKLNDQDHTHTGAQNDLRPSGGKMDQMTGDAILSDERAAMGITAQDDPFEALLVQERATAGLRRVWGVLRVPDARELLRHCGVCLG